MNKEEQLMTKFRDLFNKMGWLNEFNMTDSLKGYTPSEVHCVEAIEKNKYPNVRKLAESLYMTRGAISKLTKRLIKKGLIERYQKPDNKKEIYFRLTEQGKIIFDIHENLHKSFLERDKIVFESMSDEQFEGMLHFLENYSNHLDKEIKKQGLTVN
ncbi:MAG TPA: MarR family transcriptional regulator [Virgibacillus sp.]|nr:MarR family transcriptional regulator [Virgibacillus sp.]